MRSIPLSCRAVPAALLFLAVAGCSQPGGNAGAEVSPQSSPSPGTSVGENRPPTISGVPVTRITSGSSYIFQPTAADPDGDTLVFSIQNKPTWATFESASGRLSGVPGPSSVGTSLGVVISTSDGRSSATLAPFDVAVVPSNGTPSISGSPQLTIGVGVRYTFVPVSSDPDGDILSYTIQNKPAWAAFDSSTGGLAGTPTANDVGTTANIRIAVSDGNQVAALPSFSITVAPPSLGSVSLDWQPPTTNVDGSALIDLAGYRIAYGNSVDMLDRSLEVSNPGLTSYAVDGLAPGTWYFSVRAINRSGIASAASNVASKLVQ